MSIDRSPRALAAALAVSACLMLSGCLSTKFYVDPALPKVSKSEIAAPAAPASVNVLFEFRTKGNANARATSMTRPFALDAVRDSGVFAKIIDGAGEAADGQLTVVIDNIEITENAAAKGVGTGLTFGLAGSLVTDGYVCTVRYTRAGVAPAEVVVKHAIHTTIGNKAGPEGLAPMSQEQAVETVVSQMVLNALKQLADEGHLGAR